jgi:hypothetical protein
MATETNSMPASQIARWIAIAALIVGAVVLYFREGRRVQPLGASATPVPPPAAVDTTGAR